MMKTLACALSLVTLAAACGGDDGGMDGDPAGPDAGSPDVDETAPTIVSTTPETGAVGQPDDLAVSIEFSEPMDQDSVEGTLDTTELGDVTISWNAAGDTITITPDAPLAYAAGIGDDPSSVTALRYSVTLGNAAEDLAGNPLGAGTAISFDTLKAMGITLDPDNAMTRSMTPQALLFDNDDPLVVGDNAADQGIRTGMTFDIATLPSSAVGIASATVATRQTPGDNSGTPYVDLGDAVLLSHVMFSPLETENAINGAYNSSMVAFASHDGFCIDGQIVIEFDVTADVNDDLVNRATRSERSQFLLHFATDNDQNGDVDRAVFSRDLLELQVTYLAP